MAKPHYQIYDIPVSKRREGVIEIYLDSDVGQFIGEHFCNPVGERNTQVKYYVVRGCTAIHVDETNRICLRLVGVEKNLEKVLADIKKIAPELKPKQVKRK